MRTAHKSDEFISIMKFADCNVKIRSLLFSVAENEFLTFESSRLTGKTIIKCIPYEEQLSNIRDTEPVSVDSSAFN